MTQVRTREWLLESWMGGSRSLSMGTNGAGTVVYIKTHEWRTNYYWLPFDLNQKGILTLRRRECNIRDTLVHTTLGCFNRVESHFKCAYFIAPSTVGQCQFCGNDFIAPSTEVWTIVNNSSIWADPMQSRCSCWKNSADQSVGLPSCCINHGRWNHHFILNCLKKDFSLNKPYALQAQSYCRVGASQPTLANNWENHFFNCQLCNIRPMLIMP